MIELYDVYNEIYQPQVQREPEIVDENRPSLLGAAFRQSNDVVNVFSWLTRPTYDPDPNFDWMERSERSPLFNTNPDAFVGIESENEWAATELRVAQELRDRQRLNDGGIAGIASDIFAGVLSPTMLLPVGQLRNAKTVYSALASTAAWSVVAVGAQEAVLQLNQETRTAQQTAANIAIAAVVGGVLGGAVRYASPAELEAVSRGMVTPPDAAAIPSRIARNIAIFTGYGLPADIAAQAARIRTAEELTDFLSTASPETKEIIFRFIDEAGIDPNLMPSGQDFVNMTDDEFDAYFAAADDVEPVPVQLADETLPIRDSQNNEYTPREDGSFIRISPDGETIILSAEEASVIQDAAFLDSLSAARVMNPDFTPAPRTLDAGLLLGQQTRLGRAFPQFTDRGGVSQLWGSPVTTQALNPFVSMRTAMAQLSSGGLVRERNLQGIPTAINGDVESRVRLWDFQLAYAYRDMRAQYYEWFKTAKNGSKFRAMFSVRSMHAFSKEVVLAHHMRLHGQMHPIEQVNKAVDFYRERVFGPLIREAQTLKTAGYSEMDFDLAVNRAMQMLRRDLVQNDYIQLKSIVKQNALEQLLTNPKILKDKTFRRVLGLGVPPSQRMLKQQQGEIFSLDEIANKITEKIMDSFAQEFKGRGVISVMQEFNTPSISNFIFIDPFKKWTDETGKELGRFLDFLETNQDVIARRFTRKVGSDVELQRAFGTTDPRKQQANAQPIWQDIKKEVLEAREAAQALPEKERIAEMKRIDNLLTQFERHFEGTVARLKHEHGLPDDPTNAGFNAGRTILNLNTLRLMGMVAVSSLADPHRIMIRFGMMNSFRYALKPLISNFKRIKLSAREARYTGAALDVYTHGRSSSMFDAFDDLSYGNKFQAGLQAITNKIGLIALFDYWTDGMKHMAASVGMGEMIERMARVADGTAKEADYAFLAALNISKEQAADMFALIKGKGGTEVSPGIYLPNTETWGKTAEGREPFDFKTMQETPMSLAEDTQLNKELELRDVFRAALGRLINDTIITPGVERPLWVDASTAGRIIGQFRSFSFASNVKAIMIARQDALLGKHAQVWSGIVSGVGLGIMSYYLWGISVGGVAMERMLNEFEAASEGDTQALARLVDEGIARSGLLGSFEEIRKFSERAGLEEFTTFAGEAGARSPFVGPVSETLGPSVNLISNLDYLVRQSAQGEFSETSANKLRQLLPFQNVFWLRMGLNALDKIQNEVNQ